MLSLKALGRMEEAIAEVELALKYNPNHPMAKGTLTSWRAARTASPED